MIAVTRHRGSRKGPKRVFSTFWRQVVCSCLFFLLGRAGHSARSGVGTETAWNVSLVPNEWTWMRARAWATQK